MGLTSPLCLLAVCLPLCLTLSHLASSLFLVCASLPEKQPTATEKHRSPEVAARAATTLQSLAGEQPRRHFQLEAHPPAPAPPPPSSFARSIPGAHLTSPSHNSSLHHHLLLFFLLPRPIHYISLSPSVSSSLLIPPPAPDLAARLLLLPLSSRLVQDADRRLESRRVLLPRSAYQVLAGLIQEQVKHYQCQDAEASQPINRLRHPLARCSLT